MKARIILRRKRMSTYDAVETAIEQSKKHPTRSWLALLQAEDRSKPGSIQPTESEGKNKLPERETT